jgi:GTP-binding protein
VKPGDPDKPVEPSNPVKPVVCIVGRPNVGKSTLFNRLVGSRLAIVQDDPGVTRDRLYGHGDWDGEEFVVVDTGGLTPTDPSAISRSIRAQAAVGIEEADALVLLVDARAGVTAEDREVADLLRQSGKAVLLAANKTDGPRLELDAMEFYELGLGEVIPISAQHGRNTADLLDALADTLRARAAPAAPEADAAPGDRMRVALVGRPNAGKSSLINRILGEDRMLVDASPGTTRDPVDSRWDAGDARFTLVDTAGIRRKANIALDMEKIAVVKAIRAVERAQIACLVVDLEAGAAEQDARVASLIQQSGRALLLLLNKVDRVPIGSARYREQVAGLRDRLRFVGWAPELPTSAVTGRGLGKLPQHLSEVFAQWDRRISTAVINQFLEDAVQQHHPAAHRGREVKLYYGTQVSTRPPSFMFSVNDPEGIRPAYRRYLANRLREAFHFQGTPLRLFFRPRSGQKEKRGNRSSRGRSPRTPSGKKKGKGRGKGR